MLFDFAICGMIYGLDGYANVTGIVFGDKMLRMAYQQEFWEYLIILLISGLQGLLLLCAVTLCVSARCNNSFMAVIISAVCWGMPVLLRMFLTGIISIFIYATPVFLVMQGTVDDVFMFWRVVLLVSFFVGVVCTLVGFWKYKTKEA